MRVGCCFFVFFFNGERGLSREGESCLKSSSFWRSVISSVSKSVRRVEDAKLSISEKWFPLPVPSSQEKETRIKKSKISITFIHYHWDDLSQDPETGKARRASSGKSTEDKRNDPHPCLQYIEYRSHYYVSSYVGDSSSILSLSLKVLSL